MPKEPEDYNHVPLASYRRSYVSKDAHEKAIAAKDAEIELLKMELDGELAGRRDITKLLEGDTDEPRWKWIRIAISDLKDSLAAEATRAEFLESKCAKMRELLGECRDELDDRYDGAPDSVTRWAGHLVAKIDAILQRWEGGE